MTRDEETALAGAVRMRAEAEAIFAGLDAAGRELGRMRDAVAARREECLQLEADAERLLRRLLVVAEKAGHDELRAVARRELAAIEAEA
jgi:hypothetical protein